MDNQNKNNPFHGITLKAILEAIVKRKNKIQIKLRRLIKNYFH